LRRSSAHFAFPIRLLALAVAILAPNFAAAQWSGNHADGGGHSPVYQRRAFEWNHGGSARHGRGHGGRWSSPPVSAGWFQRPYPYHLDYYRMRYGGSYAPYFGNLYGPPQVVTAPPYYGPYYGGDGGLGAGGYGANGYGGPMEYPANGNGVMHEGPAMPPNAGGAQNGQPNGEGLPAPSP
jgi:hypothetical protein